MAKRKSFILYSDLKEKLEILNKEQKGELFQAILEYQCGIEEQDLDLSDLSRLAFSFIKADLDMNNEKYEKVVAARQEAGSIGGTNASNARKKVANGSKTKQTIASGSKAKILVANSSVNVNENENENEVNKLTDKEKPKKEKFEPPSLKEIQTYIKANQLEIDPEYFQNYYEQFDWKIGSRKMKSWQLTLKNWNRNNFNKAPPNERPPDKASISKMLDEAEKKLINY